MKSLILCTTASDSICKIALDSLEMKKIRFKHCDKPVGPHGIRVYSDTVITANSYELARRFKCIDVINMKEISFKDYDDYANYVSETRKYKDTRNKKEVFENDK